MNRMHPRILIVDDDAMVTHTYARLFESWFWETRRAGTVAEAIEALIEPFDMLYLDMMLPDGTGIDILKELRARKLAVPVAVVTAKGPHALEDLKGYHYDELMLKPFAFDSLKAMADRLFREFHPLPR